MKVAGKCAFVLAVALTLPVRGPAQCDCSANPGPNVDLEIAKIYGSLGDWKDAETHFVAATKDTASRKEALAGLDAARRKTDAAQTAVLGPGEVYESEHLWSEAEDLYRAAAADPSIGEKSRTEIASHLSTVLKAERGDRAWVRGKEIVHNSVEILALVVFLILLVATIRSIWRRRKIILIRPFAAPTEEIANGLAVHLKHARGMMSDPALSPAGQMPGFLVKNLLAFDDEIEPVEDLELVGTRIPFSSLANLFGRAAIQVSGGFDGIAPLGYAFSVVKTHNGRADVFFQRQVRVGVPNQQRSDLLDFSYDIIVKASSAYANL